MEMCWPYAGICLDTEGVGWDKVAFLGKFISVGKWWKIWEKMPHLEKFSSSGRYVPPRPAEH